MEKELEGIAEKLAAAVSGKGGGIGLEQVMMLLSTPEGKKVLAYLLRDGGQKIKEAAYDARNGDTRGIRDVIASVSETSEGRAILEKLVNSSGK